MSLVRVDALNGPWPLHDSAASRRIEQAALAQHAPHALMARAGFAVARLALALAPHAQHVRVWCGPGNNGGDGLVAARHLLAAGRQVTVYLLGDAASLPADAAQALQAARAAGVAISANISANPGAAPHADLEVDALLGLGARRAPQDAMAQAIGLMNTGHAPVLAVDIPSGLQPDTGQALGEAAVQATATLSLLTLKPGCFTASGRDAAGQVWLDDLGIAACPPTALLTGAPTAAARLHASHKGRFGDVAVVGGAPGMTGAAWLAARAALAAGAGRVFCSPLDAQTALLDPTRPELMGRAAWWLSSPALLADSTVACGCGAGDEVRGALPPLLSHAGRLVLDADALNAVAADGALQALLRQRTARGRATLLTPHPLEAARLLNCSTAQVQQDRIAAATALALALQCTVLLKGSGSVITAPGALPHLNPTGNAALATAGTGDVLAGWAAGLWAQQPDASALAVATQAAWQHGRAADLWPAAARGAPLRAADLIDHMLLRSASSA